MSPFVAGKPTVRQRAPRVQQVRGHLHAAATPTMWESDSLDNNDQLMIDVGGGDSDVTVDAASDERGGGKHRRMTSQ